MKGSTLEKKSEDKKLEVKKRREFHPIGDLRREMNRMFDDFFHGAEQQPWLKAWNELDSSFHARVDIKDHEDEIIVTAELPGVKLEDIEVSINPTSVSISGEKKEEKEEKEKGQYRLERVYGSFMPRLPLTCEDEEDSADASYQNGVLKIKMTKDRTVLESERKIKVREG